jgi:hypothetical protein
VSDVGDRVSEKPSESQLKALHAAMYKHDRLEHLKTLMENIAVLMNFDPTRELPVNDVRGPSGTGPQWYVPATGKIDSAVLEAADDCDTIASVLLAIRKDVEAVDFPAAARGHVTASLAAEAASWTARGAFWRDPAKPNVQAVQQEIDGHFQTAIDQIKPVSHFLKTKQAVGL